MVESLKQDEYYIAIIVCILVISCSDPGVISNSTRTGQDFTIGGTVNYECDTGFNHTGSRNRTCLGSGEWSGKSPTCNGGY